MTVLPLTLMLVRLPLLILLLLRLPLLMLPLLLRLPLLTLPPRLPFPGCDGRVDGARPVSLEKLKPPPPDGRAPPPDGRAPPPMRAPPPPRPPPPRPADETAGASAIRMAARTQRYFIISLPHRSDPLCRRTSRAPS